MKVWQFLLLLAVLTLVFGGGLLLSNAVLVPRLVHRHAEVRVPDLAGHATAEAAEIAGRSGLEVEVLREETHPILSPGTIISQLPESGQMVRTGRSIALVVSAGPPAGQVPSLAGQTARQAESTLQRDSYRIGRVLHMRREEGGAVAVAMHYPPAGNRTRKGAVVDLLVADPPPPAAFLVPDLRGRTLYDARRAVEAAGCVTAPVRYERDRDVPHGTVLGQTPVSGTRILKGETIELVASTR